MPPSIELLERRTLMDATILGPPTILNVSRKPGQQTEASIAIDPSSGGARVFVASNEAGLSQFGAVSSDGGATFTTREFATGADGLPQACCDPTAAFDEFGNLFFAYLAENKGDTHVVLSTDGGQTFNLIGTFDDDGDQPTLVTGPGRTPGSRSVWIAFNAGNTRGVAYGAEVTGLGQVGPFSRQFEIGGPTARNVGDLAIGPAGQVLAAYQTPNNEGPSDVLVQLDPDGLGKRRFGKPVTATGTNVGDFDRIPAQPRRTVDAAVGLAYDRSGGPFTGRAYLVYTDETVNENDDTDVLLRFSDDDGKSWSTPVRVNDDASGRSQFLPRIAVDQTTGTVGLAWHGARGDTGDTAAGGGTNATPNDEARFYAAVGTPTRDGIRISPNAQVTAGFSNAPLANNPLDYGDYIGLAFHAGKLMPSWADNSNSTGDNPSGTRSEFDVYAARLDVQDLAPPPGQPRELIGQFGDVGGRALHFTAAGGAAVNLSLSGGTGYAFRNGEAIDLRLIDSGRGVSLSVNARGGDAPIRLGDISTTGSIRRLSGKAADLVGTLSATGTIGAVALREVAGDVTSAGGSIRSLSAASVTSARVLSGADGATNTFAPGTVGRVTVAGAITSSLIGAGLDPVNGVLGDADDRVLGGPASVIDSITSRGGADETTRFVAGALGRARLPRAVDVTTDPRFRIL